MKSRAALLVTMIFAAAFLRLLPHPSNFEPIGAVALFAGAQLDKKRAFWIPLAAMLLSDVFLGFHRQLPIVYAAFVLITLIGFWLRERRSAAAIAACGFAAATVFFILTNFAVWAFDGMYPHTVAGLGACFVAALPFFANTLGSTLFYAAVLFGGLALAESRFPAFAPAAV